MEYDASWYEENYAQPPCRNSFDDDFINWFERRVIDLLESGKLYQHLENGEL